MTTFADYLARGTGEVEFRVVIEGCPVAFVTSEAMQGTEPVGGLVEGRRRVAGLLRRGLTVSESVNIPGTELRVTVGSLTIEDTARGSAWYLCGASEVFTAIARPVSYLKTSVDNVTVVWSVQRAAAFTVGTVYHCDTEAVLVTARDTTANTITVRRAMWGTATQSHFVERTDIAGATTLVCPIYSAPRTYRNRRVWIYGHGASELGTTSDGTLIARAIVSGTPRCDGGMTWQVSLEPRTQLLEQDIGPSDTTTTLSGIYYASTAPFVVRVLRQAGTDASGVPTDDVTLKLAGWWATQADWCAALASALNAHATISTWGVTFSATEFGSAWRLRVTTPSASPRYLRVIGGSPVDGYDFVGQLRGEPGYEVWTVSTSTTYVCLGGLIPLDAAWAASNGIRTLSPAQLSAVPRSSNITADPDTSATYPRSRFYLSTVAGVGVGDSVSLTVPTGEATLTVDGTVSAISTGSGYIELDETTMRFSGVDDALFGAQCSAGTSVALVSNFGTNTDLAGFLTNVLAASSLRANAGTMPFVTYDDFASLLSSISPVVAAASMGRPWLTRRVYSFGARVKLSDVLKHEARLYSLFLCLDATGAMTWRPVATRAPNDFTFDASNKLHGDADDLAIDIDLEPDGIVTGARFKTSYNITEDEHEGGLVDVVAVGATAAQRAYRPIEIAPKSRAAGTEPTVGDLYVQGSAVVQRYSTQRFVVQVDAPVTWTQRLTGDAGLVTIAQVPYDGQRSSDGGPGGLVLRRGVIIGKSWALDDPSVRLTLQFDPFEASGYAPQGRVASQSGSGTSWSVTLSASTFSGVVDAAFFATGMKVRLVEYDATTPTERTGTVSSVVGNVVALTLDAAWVPGTSTWDLVFRETDTTGTTSKQLEYAAIANSAFVIPLAGGVFDVADLFSP